jgi:hypothetical protein
VAPYAPLAYPGQAILPGAPVDTTAGTVTLPLHRGRLADGRLVWHVITDASDAGAGEHLFPPATAQPGSVGDARHSPLVRVKNRRGLVLDATVAAFDVPARELEFPLDHAKVIDRAVAISSAAGTVTFNVSLGVSSAHPIVFVSLDANSPLVAALEGTTVAPALNHLPVGRDDAPDTTRATARARRRWTCAPARTAASSTSSSPARARSARGGSARTGA